MLYATLAFIVLIADLPEPRVIPAPPEVYRYAPPIVYGNYEYGPGFYLRCDDAWSCTCWPRPRRPEARA